MNAARSLVKVIRYEEKVYMRILVILFSCSFCQRTKPLQLSNAPFHAPSMCIRSDGRAVQSFKYNLIISCRDSFCKSDTDCGNGGCDSCDGSGCCFDTIFTVSYTFRPVLYVTLPTKAATATRATGISMIKTIGEVACTTLVVANRQSDVCSLYRSDVKMVMALSFRVGYWIDGVAH